MFLSMLFSFSFFLTGASDFRVLTLLSSDTQNRQLGEMRDYGGSLFNGTTLEGWTVKCREKDRDKDYWQVEDGTITAEVPAGSDHHYIWLMSEKVFGDFELRLEVQSQAEATLNSGVQVRSRYDDEAGWLDGPQVDIHPPGPCRCGFIYDETRGVQAWLSPIQGKSGKAKPSDAPADCKWVHAAAGEEGDADAGWNDVRIICKGTRIQTFINGVPICDYDGGGVLDDANHRKRNVGMKGHIALQIHPGGQGVVRFKDVRVRELE